VAKQEVQKHEAILLRPVYVSSTLIFLNLDKINSGVVQTAAKLALELHGRELEPGHRLNVYISNPERRKERTDADANAREVYVAGLSKFVTKDDLTKLFRTVSSLVMSMFLFADRCQYGPVKEVRMALNAENHSKGFAFIEFEEEVGLSVVSRVLGRVLTLGPPYLQKDAAKALGANNYELKKRRIAVTMSDPRVRSQKR
jgi:RNA recognition motif-containing protein